MFESLTAPAGDPILSLIAEYKNDPRANKIDLGIGVYRDEKGETPVMRAVRAAEQQLLGSETTKSYQGLVGDEAFNSIAADLVLGNSPAKARAVALQTPGASGALRMLADLIAAIRPNATVWISNPSYINHRPIMERAGLAVADYPYLNAETRLVDEEAMLAQVAQLGKDDVLLLHGCCHNPSGADLSFEAWQRITELAKKQGFLPFVDIAYQGLGDGLNDDAQGLRHLVNEVDEALISMSCSKNFGLYRDRTGAAIVVSHSADRAHIIRSKMCELARGTYSMPPAHGAAIVRTILSDDGLTADWQAELVEMNQRVLRLREAMVAAFREASQSERFDYFGQHRGMFSLTGLSNEIIAQLKADHGIYIVGGGRINVAGLQESQVETLAKAVIVCGG